MDQGLAALGTFLDQGLPALGHLLYPGLTALGPKMDLGLPSPGTRGHAKFGVDLEQMRKESSFQLIVKDNFRKHILKNNSDVSNV